ncbi:MAG: ABC transporter substrate-binding protein [Salaquimonas sp.]|nr:ABC transporter substrate-binding protein [Salaquimonas sp.]
MKRLALTVAISATLVTPALMTPAFGATIKLGLLLGFTGPLDSVAPTMLSAAELAVKEINDSGLLLDGSKLELVKADSTCIDANVAVTAADKVVTADHVDGIVGAMCSGASSAILQKVAIPNNVVMISPSATSPALSTIEDNGLFFRVSPSDARQGEVVAQMMYDRGIRSAALTYTNNDYGKGLSDSIQTNFKKLGGTITISAAHEDGKADYTADVAALAAAGGEILVVVGYPDQGGKGILQAAVDADAFGKFVLPDGLAVDSLMNVMGNSLNGSFGTLPGFGPNADKFKEIAAANGFKIGPYTGESYDDVALFALAMQAAKSSNSADYKDKIFEVANAPGTQIGPGELAKGLKILAEGGDVDYVGASSVELIGPGESAGNFRLIEVKDGKVVTVGGQAG